MPNFDDPEDFESTVALTGDELKRVTLEEEEAVTGQRPLSRAKGGSMRDRTVPLAYAPESTTTELPAVKLSDSGDGPPPFDPPPFPPPAFAPRNLGPPLMDQAQPTPILRSRVEQPLDLPPGSLPTSALAPISTFPPDQARVTRAPRAPASTRPAAPAPGEADAKAPGWVYGYLALCAALTLIGLVILFFERRMLGSSSPF